MSSQEATPQRSDNIESTISGTVSTEFQEVSLEESEQFAVEKLESESVSVNENSDTAIVESEEPAKNDNAVAEPENVADTTKATPAETPTADAAATEATTTAETTTADDTNDDTTPSIDASLESCLLGINITPPIDKEQENSGHLFYEYNLNVPYSDLTGSVNLTLLRKYSAQGLPEDDCYRGMTWRILLDYLPLDRTKWPTELLQQRQLYKDSISSWFDESAVQEITNGHELQWRSQRQRPGDSDDTPSNQLPLQQLPQHLIDEWKSRGKDHHVLVSVTSGINGLKLQHAPVDAAAIADFIDSASLLDEIRKDVFRTHSDLSFFLEPNYGHRRYCVLERILFTYAKYHTGIRYVQGMNEIVSAVYYVLARDMHIEWASNAEADTYYMMELLMADMRDVFMPALDEADTGIQGRLLSLEALLIKHDAQVHEHLKEIGIDISFFAIRWWTTLLSREFLLPDTIRLWDSMLASTHKDNFLKYVIITMLMLVREDLLHADFSTALRLLQNYPSTHMDGLLESSRALWVYESQITLACHRGNITLHQALTVLKPPASVIMAFGLPGGRMRTFIDRTAVNEKRWKDAKVAVASSAQGLFGKANKWYQTQWKKSNSTDNIADTKTEEKETEANLDQFITPEDSIYLDAIQNVETS